MRIHNEEAFEIGIADYLCDHAYLPGTPDSFTRPLCFRGDTFFAVVDASGREQENSDVDVVTETEGDTRDGRCALR